MKNTKKKFSFSSCRTIPQTLAFLYLVTFTVLIFLGLVLVFATGFSPKKLAVLLLILGIYLIALVFAVLATRNLPRKHRIAKYKKLLLGQISVDIDALADQTGLDPEELRQDLTFLIDQNICPKAAFSEDGKFFYPNTSDKTSQERI